MDTKAKHTKTLERELITAQAVINDLVEENYNLRKLLTSAANEQKQKSRSKSELESTC